MVTDPTTVARSVRAAEYEAAFALAVTLVVCVAAEWSAGWLAIMFAFAVPGALAFSVHGLHNAAGLRAWNWIYLPLRLLVIGAGLAYSYSHYAKVIPAIEVGGYNLTPLAALMFEAVSISALVAHQAHASRLTHLQLELVPEESADVPEPVESAPSEGLTVLPALQSLPVLNGAGSNTPALNGVGSQST